MQATAFFQTEQTETHCVLRIISPDGTNRLSRACVVTLTNEVQRRSRDPKPIIICGNTKFFSTGAELAEVAALTAPEAYEFSSIGQGLMNTVEQFPAPVYAAIEGYCMGGGLDLALACHCRIASPHAIFGHRGAALGLITGWGGTQRLPRLIGKVKASEILIAAEKIHAAEALRIGLIDAIAADPVAAAVQAVKEKVHYGDTKAPRRIADC